MTDRQTAAGARGGETRDLCGTGTYLGRCTLPAGHDGRHSPFAVPASPSRETTQREEWDTLAADALATCHRRGWSTHWTARGAYLHLESSELIEAVRGKGDSTPLEEAGDVLLVLMSITENEGIPFSAVAAQARKKIEAFRTKPRYAGEEYVPETVVEGAAE